MKSEERHELQKNELTKVAGKATAVYDRYQNQILWAVVVLLLAMAAWIYTTRSSRVAAESAWTSLQAAGSPNDYVEVADRYSNSEVAKVSKLQAALAWLDMGVKAAFTNREEANSYLKDAKEEFDQLLATPNLDKSIQEQAQFGLAQTLESISGADTEAAVKAYEQLLKDFPESIYKKNAEERIKDLKKPGTQEFLAWYQKQNPKPPEPEKPKDGQGPGANSAAPKPGSETLDLGLPAPPKPTGTQDENSAAEPESKPDQSSAEPVDPKGPALPTQDEPAKSEAPPADAKSEAAPPAEQK